MVTYASLADMGAGRTSNVDDEILLSEATEMQLPAPIAVSSDMDDHELQIFWAFETARTCKFSDIRLLCLTDVYLSPEGLIFLSDGRCLIETVYPWVPANVTERFPRLKSAEDWLPAERAVANEIGEAVHLREPGESGYFHWVNSILPRIAALQRIHRLRNLSLAVNLGKSFAMQSAEMLGIDPALTLPSSQGFRCRKLWVFTPTVIKGDHFTRAIYWTNEVRRVFLDPLAQPPSRKLYLSRKDASVRAIVNEDDLIATVARYGFEPVTIGSMPFPQQVALFGSCDILVSAHGAGISNSIFMRSGRVIEILPRTRPWPTFRTLAARSGLDYAAFISGTSDKNTDDIVAEGNEGIKVDISKFETFLVRALH